MSLTVAAAACGTGGLPSDSANVSRGKDLFTSAEAQCGACHALADAGTKGTRGPNLDEAFAGPRDDGFEDSSIAALVLSQIRYPTEGSGMPANLVTGEDADDVAAYVADVAGVPEKMKAAAGGGGSGEELFTSLGCKSCHSLEGAKGTGPPLNGLKKSDAYLLESILKPDAKIAPGYQPGIMSSAVAPGSIGEADAKKLVDFIKAQK